VVNKNNIKNKLLLLLLLLVFSQTYQVDAQQLLVKRLRVRLHLQKEEVETAPIYLRLRHLKHDLKLKRVSLLFLTLILPLLLLPLLLLFSLSATDFVRKLLIEPQSNAKRSY